MGFRASQDTNVSQAGSCPSWPGGADRATLRDTAKHPLSEAGRWVQFKQRIFLIHHPNLRRYRVADWPLLARRGRSCTRIQLRILAALGCILAPASLLAQEEGPRLIQLPNPMAAHTWFIIAAVGAFLAWCISYVLQFRKAQLTEKGEKAKRTALLHEKDDLLDRLARLESEKEAGTIPGPRYEKEYRKARSRLSEVLGRLGGKRESGDD
jgi:hypothetical protein